MFACIHVYTHNNYYCGLQLVYFLPVCVRSIIVLLLFYRIVFSTYFRVHPIPLTSWARGHSWKFQFWILTKLCTRVFQRVRPRGYIKNVKMHFVLYCSSLEFRISRCKNCGNHAIQYAIDISFFFFFNILSPSAAYFIFLPTRRIR